MTKYQRPRSHYAVLIFNIAIAASLLIVGGGLLYAGQRLGARQVVSLNRGDDVAVNEDANIAPSDQWNLSEGDLEAKNFLLTGSDNGSCVDPNSPYAGAFGDRTSFGERSDTIMIIRVNPKDNQAAFLSFPRDLWVKIAGSTRSNRINTAFERKNPNTLADTIYQNFGITIDHYVNIDFCAFKEIVDAVGLPVTVETRLGWDDNSINIDEVAERLQDIGVAALSIHARTRAQMYKGHSDWSHIARVKNNPRITMPIFGNGDIDSPEKALQYKNEYGIDGIMIGRAAIGYPWIFNEIKHYFNTGEHLAKPTVIDRVEAVRNHLTWAMEWKGERLGIVETRPHYTNYFKGIHSFKPYKQKLVTLDHPEELFAALNEIEQAYAGYEVV